MERVITMSHKELSRLDVMQKLGSHSMRQSQAADILRISTRQVKRLWKAYKAQGAEGLISRKRGSKSNHQLPEEVKKQVLELILEKYSDFGPTLAQEKLLGVHGHS
ncbi:MAG: hypothetical protein K940chlam6_01677, partial [Chlamydiae bacterium]|nr:hypothetical protein [Chlamydiota bacterium]